jgi:hypothetical protein
MIENSVWFRSTLYLVTALMVAVWLIMLGVTMPHLEALTGGLKVFDMRPTGYSFEEAKAILEGLGEAGRLYYANVQQGLDCVFPALIFLMVSGWQLLLARKFAMRGLRLPVWLVVLLLAINLAGAIADYTENSAVRAMLLVAPETITEGQVAVANAATIAKSLFNTLSYLLLLAMAGYYFFRRRSPKGG